MKITFGLGWAAKGSKKIYKDTHAAACFEQYRGRIAHDFECAALALPFAELNSQPGALWICERSKKSRMLSSEELAQRFQKVCDSGAKNLTVWIGGPDGISAEQLNALKSDLIWSFGPMTLPHELASVVAAEQVYRAISILKNHPYHQGH